MTRSAALAGTLLLAALACAAPARAHDSWLVARAAARGSAFGLSTGNRYPLAEIAPPAQGVAQAGCTDAHGRRHRLQPGEAAGPALALRTPAGGALGCWVALHAFEITLEPRLVEVYLGEIRPGDAVRAAWMAQVEQGLPWTERYRKFARIEHGAARAAPEALRRLRAPAGLPLEIVVDGDAPLRSGEPARFRVLANGVPVEGLAVELVSERSRFGVWSRSDAQGLLQHRIPFPGAWLLRATLLEPDAPPGAWRSRFATLAFEAG